MLSKLLLCFLLISATVWGDTKIPDTLTAGPYSVTMHLNAAWAAQVFAKQGRIVYNYLYNDRGKVMAIQLTVVRVALPVDCALMEGAEIADKLVVKDGLKFQHTLFGKPITLTKKPALAEFPAGNAFIYELTGYADREPHYGQLALMLPPDYRSRLIGYLVVGHQVNSFGTTLEQAPFFNAILQSLRENRR